MSYEKLIQLRDLCQETILDCACLWNVLSVRFATSILRLNEFSPWIRLRMLSSLILYWKEALFFTWSSFSFVFQYEQHD